MAWHKLTEIDLASKLSQSEIDDYRISSGYTDDGSVKDPVAGLLEMTANRVRGYCRQNTSIRLAPEEDTIPQDLVSAAMDIAAFDILKRMPMDVNDPRKTAYDRALELMDKVASGAYLPEPYGSTDDENDRVLPLYAFDFRPDMLVG